MIMLRITVTIALIFFVSNNVTCTNNQPNIVFILADDYGYNDVGYHGSEIKTPNIDKLATSGVILENYYVQPICTPSRSQLLTGRYQIHTGLQHSVIFACQPMCVPLDEVMLPQKLKEVGYESHIVGKWHLGFYKKQCLPTYRGFDTHYGYYTSKEDYYTKMQCNTVKNKNVCGYDFHDNLNPDFSANGTYSPELYTTRVRMLIAQHNPKKPMFLYLPLQSVHSPEQAPQKYVDMYANIKNKARRYHAAMVTAMDDAIGDVVRAIKEKGIYNNTLIIFSTDNGGQTLYGGNNWPLRGRKATLWEGGIHGVGFIHGVGIKNPGRISNELVHISDWFPTLVHLAGGNLNLTKKLDGYNVWDSISTADVQSPRREILHNIDPEFYPPDSIAPSLKPFPNKFGFNTTQGHAALRMGKWKLHTGYPGYDKRVPVPFSRFLLVDKNLSLDQNHLPKYPSVQLFNIVNDPTESSDVSKSNPAIVDTMIRKLSEYAATAVPIVYPNPDLACNPALHGGVWKPWK